MGYILYAIDGFFRKDMSLLFMLFGLIGLLICIFWLNDTNRGNKVLFITSVVSYFLISIGAITFVLL